MRLPVKLGSGERGFAALIKDRWSEIGTEPHPAGIRHQCAAEQVEQPRLAGAAEGRRLVG